MSRIFLSYRRVDSAGRTGRLQDALEARFGRDKVFQDIESLDAGVDFPDAVDRILASCDAVLVMIGRDWSSVEEMKGRRLDQEDDLVRIEVASALKRDNVRVIPVLVDGAVMPKAEELPEDLRALVRKNAVELSDLRWDYDVSRLTASLAKALGIPEDKPRSKVGGTFGIVAAIAVIGLVAVLAGSRFFSGSGAMSLLQGLEKPGLEVDAANPNLIVHERILGGGYGIINDEPWRHKVLVRSGEDRLEFFQPRAKVVDGRVFVLYLAKAWDVNEIFLFELDVEAGETHEVVRMPYKSGQGYYFNSPNNLIIRGSELYFSDGYKNGMRYRIGSKSAPVKEDFYPTPGASVSPSRYRRAAVTRRLQTSKTGLPVCSSRLLRTTGWQSEETKAVALLVSRCMTGIRTRTPCSSSRSTRAIGRSARSSGPTTVSRSSSTIRDPSPVSGDTTSVTGFFRRSCQSTMPVGPSSCASKVATTSSMSRRKDGVATSSNPGS